MAPHAGHGGGSHTPEDRLSPDSDKIKGLCLLVFVADRVQGDPYNPHFLFFMPLYNLYPLYVGETCDCFYPTEYLKEMNISSVIALHSVRLHLSNKLTLQTYLADLMKWPCW